MSIMYRYRESTMFTLTVTLPQSVPQYDAVHQPGAVVRVLAGGNALLVEWSTRVAALDHAATLRGVGVHVLFTFR